MPDQPAMRAMIDFDCTEEDCGQTIEFNLLDLRDSNGEITCENCRRSYLFDDVFLDKLDKLRVLVLAVQDAETILGDCNVSITTPAGDVRIPYRLLLTRLNTQITLNSTGQKMDFHFRVEPLNNLSFR